MVDILKSVRNDGRVGKPQILLHLEAKLNWDFSLLKQMGFFKSRALL